MELPGAPPSMIINDFKEVVDSLPLRQMWRGSG